MNRPRSERAKALWLATWGALGLTTIFFGMGAMMVWVIQATDTINRPDNNPGQLSVDTIGNNVATDIAIDTYQYNESSPYQFSIETYIFAGSSPLVAEYNQQIEDYVADKRDDFESDLEFFLGDVESPDSYLDIRATDITQNNSQIEISYQITEFVSGDTQENILFDSLDL